jgi:hypothetical protein
LFDALVLLRFRQGGFLLSFSGALPIDQNTLGVEAQGFHKYLKHFGLRGYRSGTGRTWQAWAVAPWKLPLLVIAIVVPIALGFYAGGPGLGIAVGALAAVGIVVVAVRQRPRGEIGEPAAGAGPRRVLIVVSRALDEPAAIDEVVRRVPEAGAAAEGTAEVLVLSPAQIGFLDRWASDVEAARREAQERLVITVASLAKAGLVAEARVGDEDLVQAVEDQLRSFAATDVILITGTAVEDPAGEAAAIELGRRLRAEFRRLTLSGRAAR